ncbi:MAG: hypothetical protein HYZ15_12890 [Sphingobacteriales bacterium]|nr:hypothetical protein [Sphingobacteriales bacterium]
MQDQQEHILLRKIVEFSLLAIEWVELLGSLKEQVIAGQSLRSAASIGANAQEAGMQKVKQILYMRLKLHEIGKIKTKIISTSKAR